MKLLVASDIHGSAYFLNKLMDRVKSEKPERILLLGDLLYHGPRNDLPEGYDPKKCIDIYNSIKNDLICVRGNCDGEVDQMVLQFPITSDIAYVYINGLNIIASHGHKFNPDNLPATRKGDVFLFGHTHVPYLEDKDGVICMNPGSVSIPKNDSEHSYMTISVDEKSEKAVFEYKNLDGEVYKTYTYTIRQ